MANDHVHVCSFEFVLTGWVEGVKLVAVKYVLQNVFQISETLETYNIQLSKQNMQDTIIFHSHSCHLIKKNV